jgi:hypothetical protein
MKNTMRIRQLLTTNSFILSALLLMVLWPRDAQAWPKRKDLKHLKDQVVKTATAVVHDVGKEAKHLDVVITKSLSTEGQKVADRAKVVHQHAVDGLKKVSEALERTSKAIAKVLGPSGSGSGAASADDNQETGKDGQTALDDAKATIDNADKAVTEIQQQLKALHVIIDPNNTNNYSDTADNNKKNAQKLDEIDTGILAAADKMH